MFSYQTFVLWSSSSFILSLHMFLSNMFFFICIYFLFCTRSSEKSIRKKINNDSRWNTSTIAHKHKHSHFCPKATGLHDLSSSLGKEAFKHEQRPTCVHLITWQQTDRLSSSLSAVSCPQCVRTLLQCSSPGWPLSLCASLCPVSAVGVTLRSATLVNCPGDRWWGSKWSSLPSPSPWQPLDSPTGIRCWPARGISLWSPKRGHRHLTPKMWDTQPSSGETLSVTITLKDLTKAQWWRCTITQKM